MTKRWINICLISFFWLFSTLFYVAFNNVNSSTGTVRLVMTVNLLMIFALNGKYLLEISRSFLKQYTLVYLLVIFLSFCSSLILGRVHPSYINSFLLNAFFPFLFFLIANKSSGMFHEFVIKILIISTILNGIIAISTSPVFNWYIPVISDIGFVYAHQGGSSSRLVSLIGNATTLGYFALVSLSFVLFGHWARYRYLTSSFLIIIVLFTRQRGVYAGLLILMAIYTYSLIKSKRISLKQLVLTTVFMSSVLYALKNLINTELSQQLVRSTLSRSSLGEAMGDRSSQQVLLITNDNIFTQLFGRGYGSHSALNKGSEFMQPDAPYWMLTNETGYLGFLLFIGFLLSVVFVGLKTKSKIILFLGLHIIIGLLGSRYLWYFPVNYLFFYVLGYGSNLVENN
jgi:hypothetical protein